MGFRITRSLMFYTWLQRCVEYTITPGRGVSLVRHLSSGYVVAVI
jgi:hypothetical protein